MITCHLRFQTIKAVKEAKPFPVHKHGRGYIVLENHVYEQLWLHQTKLKVTFDTLVMGMCNGEIVDGGNPPPVEDVRS